MQRISFYGYVIEKEIPLTLIHFSVSISWLFKGLMKIKVNGRIVNIPEPAHNHFKASDDVCRRQR